MVVIAGTAGLTHAVNASPPAQEGTTKARVLFDGRTFDGWQGDTTNIFRIEHGAIVGGSLKTNLSRNEFLCTKGEYSDFEIQLKFKLPGKTVNGGVQFRSRRVPNSSEMSGYQADLGYWDGKGLWGDLYDESRRNKKLAEANQMKLSKVLNLADWNELRIRCEGRRIQIWINGHQTVDYTEPDEKIEQKGLIGLQIHAGPPSEAWYKDIFITTLSSP